MYSDWVWMIGLVTFTWFIGLTFFIWKQHNFLKLLFPKSGERDIRKKFEEILNEVNGFGKNLDELKDKLSEIEKLGVKHIQRIELLRYNPYDDTGGDQSFTLALLDEKGRGLVLTSLHARSGTRVFAKGVMEGKSSKYNFSEEEERAINQAMKKNG